MKFSRVEKQLELEADHVSQKSYRSLFPGRDGDLFVMTINKKGPDTYEHKVIYLTNGSRHTYYFYARESFDFVQRIEDHWLFVQGRSERDKKDLNASIFSCDGKLVHQFYAGDDIMECQVDADNDIWLAFAKKESIRIVSYLDMGLFV